MTNTGKIVLLIFIIILIGVAVLIFGSKPMASPVDEPLITNFEECKEAGYPIMESYPEQCRTPNGNLFVRVIENQENPIKPAPEPVVEGGCYIGGCSAQICSDQKDVASTCEYREEYGCYKTAECERQDSGECGWTETPALLQCLSSSKVSAGYIEGHVTIGPNCPVEEEGKPCKTPPEAYSSRSVYVYENNGATVKYIGKINSIGEYKITIEPGKYLMEIKPAGIGPGEMKTVTVKSFETTTVNFDIDTGIR